jgi:hypothetical protein
LRFFWEVMVMKNRVLAGFALLFAATLNNCSVVAISPGLLNEKFTGVVTIKAEASSKSKNLNPILEIRKSLKT